MGLASSAKNSCDLNIRNKFANQENLFCLNLLFPFSVLENNHNEDNYIFCTMEQKKYKT